MTDTRSVSLKSEAIMKKKKKLNLAMNILIAFLGVTSLYEKFFLIDGIIAFRAFTVDGNLFTTIVTIIAVIYGIRSLGTDKETDSRVLFFLELCAAVTEAVIFIVVMIGYLPFFPDTPKITPYHMFCLHVAIPVLTVVRFIFFERPLGIMKPAKLLIGAIPIGVYGIFVVTAIKLGILPVAFVPYSFLDFESNFLWYFLFALLAIPSFGYLWAWTFYRLNLRASVLWYKKTELEALEKQRIHALSRFDVVNSTILIVFIMLALFVLTFSLMTTSNTSTTIQHELLSAVSYLKLANYDRALGEGEWRIEDGILYKGDMLVSSGPWDYDYEAKDFSFFNSTIFIKASDMTPEAAQYYEDNDYVAVKHITGVGGPAPECGDILNPEIVDGVYADPDHVWYEQVKVKRALSAAEKPYAEQVRNATESYYHFCMTFGATMDDDGVGLIEMYIPAAQIIQQAKNAELNGDITMAVIIMVTFSVLYIISRQWIRSLEKSVEFLKVMARGGIPEEPLDLGKGIRILGLTKELNQIRDDKIRQSGK